jgi:hypothetical protein
MSEYNIFYDNLILVPIVSFAVAVILKGLSEWAKTGKVNVKRAL